MNLHPVGEILDNQVLLIALCSSLTAQILKLFIELAQFRQLRFKIMFETGGMPSSHSALVSALATANDPKAPTHPWIERDPGSGAASLKIPLPPPETTRQLADALALLAHTLRGNIP